jgi:hypothetical protein
MSVKIKAQGGRGGKRKLERLHGCAGLDGKAVFVALADGENLLRIVKNKYGPCGHIDASKLEQLNRFIVDNYS